MYFRSHASLALLSTLVLSQASFAAPKPPPGDQAYVAARAQQMRFQAAGLTIPAVPGNGGLCLIETSGHVAPPTGQAGISGSYRYYEIQRWVVAPLPMMVGNIPLTYAVKWDTVGNGFRHEDNGVGTVNDWAYQIGGEIGVANDTQLTARKTLAGSWLVQIAPTSVPNVVWVGQQQTISGRANTPIVTKSPAYSVGIPGMTIDPQPGSPPNTPVTGSRSQFWRVPQQIGWGYPMPGYATGAINCTWNLAVGP